MCTFIYIYIVSIYIYVNIKDVSAKEKRKWIGSDNFKIYCTVFYLFGFEVELHSDKELFDVTARLSFFSFGPTLFAS